MKIEYYTQNSCNISTKNTKRSSKKIEKNTREIKKQ